MAFVGFAQASDCTSMFFLGGGKFAFQEKLIKLNPKNIQRGIQAESEGWGHCVGQVQ